MPLWIFPALLAAAAIVTLVSGIWLLLHLTALARTFAGNADLVPAPSRPRASRRAIRLGLGAFGAGLLVTLVVLVIVVSGLANELVGPAT
jgi:hypothetical protein